MMHLHNRVVTWRVAAVIVSVIVLSVAASRISSVGLLQTFSRMHPGWFLGALALNGFLFIPAAMRWHIVLGLTGQAVSFPATLRSALSGHFFYVGLFGAAGGDSARSAYYAKWYRHSLPAVLATAPLDRLLGLAGLLIFAAFGFALAIGFSGLKDLKYEPAGNPLIWLVAPIVLGLVFWAIKKASEEGVARQFLQSFLDGARRLIRSPGRALAGVACGILVQASLSGVLALNLEAVSPAGIEWTRLVWTLPLISLLGGLPVTVAGLGTREAAAIGLLGLYGIEGEVAMAASLLCLVSTLFWAVCGALVFWSEGHRHEKADVKQ